MILFGPLNVRIQYHFGVATNCVLTKNIPEKKVKISNDGDLCNSHLWVPNSLSSNWAHNLLVLMGFLSILQWEAPK